MSSLIRGVGPEYLELGYEIVGVSAGVKAPMYKGWQSRGLTLEEVYKRPMTDGVGILCGRPTNPVCAVDVDVTDEELSQALLDMICEVTGELLVDVRYGRRPKFLIPFKAEKAGWKKFKTELFVKDMFKAQIEFLGDGQQFVASHIHPETLKPYMWELVGLYNEPKLMTRYEDLPVITEEDIRNIAERFKEMCEERGYSVVQDAQGASAPSLDEDEGMIPVVPPLEGVGVDEMRSVLEKLIEGEKLNLGSGTHDEWVKLGMAIHHQTEGSKEGLALWDEISAKFPDAYDPHACAKRWGTFKDDHTGGVTFRTYMQRYKRMTDGPQLMANEYGLLHRVIDKLGDRALYLPQISDWVFFDTKEGKWDTLGGKARVTGVVRETFEIDLLEEIKDEVEDSRRKELMKLRAQCLNKTRAHESNVVTMLSMTSSLIGDLGEFDKAPYLFGVKNGVLDVRDRSMRANTASLRVMRQAGAKYIPGAKCPTWEQCMLDWMDDDKEKVRYVQRLLGQAITGSPKEDVFLMLRGVGCNGKSVFLNTLSDVFGEYAEVISENTLVGFADSGAAGRARSDLVKLRGARLVYCSETSAGLRLKEADVKRMTGRDPINARAPYGRADVRIMPTWLLCMGTNHVPEVKGDDEGIWRRIADVEFPRNFMTDPRVTLDPELSEKLQKELSGILNWVLDGFDEYQKIGLSTPESVTKATAAYREEMDDVKAWATQRLVPTGDAKRVSVQMFYSDFVLWMKGQGAKEIDSQAMFTRRLNKYLKSRGDSKGVVRSCSIQRVEGFALRQEATDFEELPEKESVTTVSEEDLDKLTDGWEF